MCVGQPYPNLFQPSADSRHPVTVYGTGQRHLGDEVTVHHEWLSPDEAAQLKKSLNVTFEALSSVGTSLAKLETIMSHPATNGTSMALRSSRVRGEAASPLSLTSAGQSPWRLSPFPL
jgi:hypothetical protein